MDDSRRSLSYIKLIAGDTFIETNYACKFNSGRQFDEENKHFNKLPTKFVSLSY